MTESSSMATMISFSLILVSFFIRMLHLLPSMLILESLNLFMICFIPCFFALTSLNSSFTIIILLITGACTTSMGLALLFSSGRLSGNDKAISTLC